MKKVWIERFEQGNPDEMYSGGTNTEHNPKCSFADSCEECWPSRDVQKKRVSAGSPEGSELIQKIYATNFDPKFEDRFWRIESLFLIENAKLNKQFEEYRAKLQNTARHPDTLKDTLVFTAESEKACRDICEDGCRVTAKKRHILGHTGSGVHVVRHYDILTRYLMYQQYTAPFIVVYKTLLGRSKPIVPRLHKDDNFVSPHVDFDCHVSARSVEKQMPICLALNCSYVYLYEFDETSSNTVKYPSQILPYAVVQLEKKTPCIPENPCLAVASADSVSDWEVKGETRRGFRFVFSNSGLKGKHKVFTKGDVPSFVESELKGQILEMRTKSPKSILEARPPLLQRMDGGERETEKFDEDTDATTPPDLQKMSPIKSSKSKDVFNFHSRMADSIDPDLLLLHPQLKLQPRVKLRRMRTYYEKNSHNVEKKEKTKTKHSNSLSPIVAEQSVTQRDLESSKQNNNSEGNSESSTQTFPTECASKESVQYDFSATEKSPSSDFGKVLTHSSRLKAHKSKFGSVKCTIDKERDKRPFKPASTNSQSHQGDSTNGNNPKGSQYEFVVQPKSSDDLKIKISKKTNQVKDTDKDTDVSQKSKERDLESNLDNINGKYTVRNIHMQNSGEKALQQNERSKLSSAQQIVLEKSQSPVAANAAPECLNLSPVLVSANIATLTDGNDHGVRQSMDSNCNKGSKQNFLGNNSTVNKSNTFKDTNSLSKNLLFEAEMRSFFGSETTDYCMNNSFVKEIHSSMHQTQCVNPVLRCELEKSPQYVLPQTNVCQGRSTASVLKESSVDTTLTVDSERQHTPEHSKRFASRATSDSVNVSKVIESSLPKRANKAVKMRDTEPDVNVNESPVHENEISDRIDNTGQVNKKMPFAPLKVSESTSSPSQKGKHSTKNQAKCTEKSVTKSKSPDTKSSTRNVRSKFKGKQKGAKEKSARFTKVAKSKPNDGIIRVNNEVVKDKQQEILSNGSCSRAGENIKSADEMKHGKDSSDKSDKQQNQNQNKKENVQIVKVDSCTANKLRCFLNSTAAAALQSKRSSTSTNETVTESGQTKSCPTSSDLHVDKGSLEEDNVSPVLLSSKGYSDPKLSAEANFVNSESISSDHGFSSSCPPPLVKPGVGASGNNILNCTNAKKRDQTPDVRDNDSQDKIIGGVSMSPTKHLSSVTKPCEMSKLHQFETVSESNSLEFKPDVYPVKHSNSCHNSETSVYSETTVNNTAASSEHNVTSSRECLLANLNTDVPKPVNSGTHDYLCLSRVKQEPIDDGYEQHIQSRNEETHEENKSKKSADIRSVMSGFLPRTRQEIANGAAMLNATECRNAIIDTLKELSNVLKLLSDNNTQQKPQQMALVAHKMFNDLTEKSVKEEKGSAHEDSHLSIKPIKTEPVDDVNSHSNVSRNLNTNHENVVGNQYESEFAESVRKQNTEIPYEYMLKPDESEILGSTQPSTQKRTEKVLDKRKDCLKTTPEFREENTTTLSGFSCFDELPRLFDASGEPNICDFELFGIPKIQSFKHTYKGLPVTGMNEITSNIGSNQDVKPVLEELPDVKPIIQTLVNSKENQLANKKDQNTQQDNKSGTRLLTDIKTEKDDDCQLLKWRSSQSFNLKTGVLNKGWKERKNMFDLKNRNTGASTKFLTQRQALLPSRNSFHHKPSRDLEKNEKTVITEQPVQMALDRDQTEKFDPDIRQTHGSISIIPESEQREVSLPKATNSNLSEVDSTASEMLREVKQEQEEDTSIGTAVTPDSQVTPVQISDSVTSVESLKSGKDFPNENICTPNISAQRKHVRPETQKERHRSNRGHSQKGERKYAIIPFHTVVRLKQQQFRKYKRGETNKKFLDYREVFAKISKDKLKIVTKKVENKNNVTNKAVRSAKNRDIKQNYPYPIPKYRKAALSARGAALIEDDLDISEEELPDSQTHEKRKRSVSKESRSPKRSKMSSEKTRIKSTNKSSDSHRSRSKSSHRSSDENQRRSLKSHLPSRHRHANSKSTSNKMSFNTKRRSDLHRKIQDSNKQKTRWSVNQRFPSKTVFAQSGTGYFSWRRKYQPKRNNNEIFVVTDKGLLQRKDEFDRWTKFKERETLRIQIEKAIKDYRRTYDDTPDDKEGDEKVASYLDFLATKLDELQTKRAKMNNPGKNANQRKTVRMTAKKKLNPRRRKSKRLQETQLLQKLDRSRMLAQIETAQHSSIARFSNKLASDSDSLSYKQLRHASNIEDLLREHLTKHYETLTKQIKQEITQELSSYKNRSVRSRSRENSRDRTRSTSHDRALSASRDRTHTPTRDRAWSSEKDRLWSRDKEQPARQAMKERSPSYGFYEKNDGRYRSERDRDSRSARSNTSSERSSDKGEKRNSTDNQRSSSRDKYSRSSTSIFYSRSKTSNGFKDGGKASETSSDKYSDVARREGGSTNIDRNYFNQHDRESIVPITHGYSYDDSISLPDTADDAHLENLNNVCHSEAFDSLCPAATFDKYDFQQNFDKYQCYPYNRHVSVTGQHAVPVDFDERFQVNPMHYHFRNNNKKQWFSGKYDKYRSYNGTRHKAVSFEESGRRNNSDTAAPPGNSSETKYRQFSHNPRIQTGKSRESHGTVHRSRQNPKPRYQPAKFSRFRNPATYYFYDDSKRKKSNSDNGKEVKNLDNLNPVEVTAVLKHDDGKRQMNCFEDDKPKPIPTVSSHRPIVPYTFSY